MKKCMIAYLFATAALLLLLVPGVAQALAPGSNSKVECDDLYDSTKGGQLNLMTINLLFDLPGQLRQESLRAIANFAVANNIHVILVQEAVRTKLRRIENLLGTFNSAEDLKSLLNGLNPYHPYELHIAYEAGVPGALATANAILSRCEVVFHFWKFLPVTESLTVQNIHFPITRNVQMMQVTIPNFGKMDVYNTHLCATCTSSQLAEAVKVLLDVVSKTEALFPGEHPVILGGDFNLDRFRSKVGSRSIEQGLYTAIVGAGFGDSYADFQSTLGITLNKLCPGALDRHCTEGASPLSGITDRGRRPEPQRIDYLFTRGIASVVSSQALFNPLALDGGSGPAVSDHSAVMTQVNLGPRR